MKKKRYFSTSFIILEWNGHNDVKGAGNKSVAGDENKSISSHLIDLDYYSITEHITEKDLFTRI